MTKLLSLHTRMSIVVLFSLVLAACAERVVEQTRYDYVNSTGRTLPITYEVASDWEVGNGGRYYLPGVARNQANLSVNVSSAKTMKETLPEKLRRVTRRGASDKDRHILTTQMTKIHGVQAMVYAEQGEAYKPPEDRYFTHVVEFVSGLYLIDLKIRGHSDYYPVLLKQLDHTLDSIQIRDEA
ncbi:MAG: hypothetical protein ACFHXK_22010 [bacterium]